MHETISFLQSLEDGTTAQLNRNELISNLVKSLSIDGISLNDQIQIQSQRSLRGLSEATMGGVNIEDVALVGVCIICAGLASGLTQV